MAWNEPGKGGKEPWKSGNDANADIEAFIRKFREFFGGTSGGNRRGSGVGQGGPGLLIVVLGLLSIWIMFDSWQLIDERQRGVVLRFGEFHRLMTPGPNFKWPRPIERVYRVNITDVRSVSDQVRMLTRDENIVQISLNVQYLVSDPEAYLFGARNPDETLKQAAESAVRDVIGSSTMDMVLTGERAALAADARTRLQVTLDNYRTGLQVTVFNLQDARPPNEVREAFDDAISAREDKERIESEALAYASKVVPEARGQAARIRAQAEGYRDAQVARAAGDAERFNLLYEEFRKAPEVTRKRLYLETVEQVLAENRKVYAGDGNNVLYLPLDGQTASGFPPAADSPVGRLPGTTSVLPSNQPESSRDGRPARPGRDGSNR
ncbi:MAG TPA: FtsH protease activity modulator HflK [Xanthomonadales bacterium]|nr:FtsH protease activity modulator HflK [Xanthomonadales bacterium]